jgi:microcystin-dependent protein
MDGYIGEIRAYSFDYAPPQWVHCNGAAVTEQQCPSIVALLGNRYGPQPSPNSALLPNLNGRAIVGAGVADAQSLTKATSTYALGQTVGQPTAVIGLNTANNLGGVPVHRHTLNAKFVIASPFSGVTGQPSSTAWLSRAVKLNPSNHLAPPSLDKIYHSQPVSGVHLSPSTLSQVGGVGGNAQPHENRQPYLVLNYCFCIQGVFPQPPDQEPESIGVSCAG